MAFDIVQFFRYFIKISVEFCYSEDANRGRKIETRVTSTKEKYKIQS